MTLTPFLSVVVVTRNDNHGQSLNYRTQEFIDLLAFQCEKFELQSELIIVEWNPPQSNPKLIDQFNFPESKKILTRIIEVPEAIHKNYEFSEKIPLYQMIGKNVGIARSTGKYVLATNIDVIFSDETFLFIKNKLNEGTVYTAVRHDIPSALPKVEPTSKLKWSSKNFFRVHHSLGSITLIKKSSNISYKVFGKIYILYILYARAAVLRFRTLLPQNLQLSSSPFLFTLDYYFYKKLVSTNVYKKLILTIVSRFKRLSLQIFYGLINLYQLSFNTLDKPHTNACGDFTLCSKKIWETLRGYPEWDMYSWHIDSVFIHQAKNSGFPNKIVEGKIFHIEHSPGSGYTPEHADLLFDRFQQYGVPCLSNEDLVEIILRQSKALKPISYNHFNWGLCNFNLTETKVRQTRNYI